MTDRKFWQEVRRGLLTIVAAIVKRWLEEAPEDGRLLKAAGERKSIEELEQA